MNPPSCSALEFLSFQDSALWETPRSYSDTSKLKKLVVTEGKLTAYYQGLSTPRPINFSCHSFFLLISWGEGDIMFVAFA